MKDRLENPLSLDDDGLDIEPTKKWVLPFPYNTQTYSYDTNTDNMYSTVFHTQILQW